MLVLYLLQGIIVVIGVQIVQSCSHWRAAVNGELQAASCRLQESVSAAGPGTGTSDQSDVMEGDRTDQSRRLSLHLDLATPGDVASLSSLSAQSKMKNFKKVEIENDFLRPTHLPSL